MYWPRIAADICEYIWGFLLFVKWAISAKSISPTLIQTGKPYELIRINFISPFKKSAYGNTYIYNLVDYFLRHMYPHPRFGDDTNNIIILFDHYLRANSKPYAVYMNTDSHFISQKLHKYF